MARSKLEQHLEDALVRRPSLLLVLIIVFLAGAVGATALWIGGDRDGMRAALAVLVQLLVAGRLVFLYVKSQRQGPRSPAAPAPPPAARPDSGRETRSQWDSW